MSTKHQKLFEEASQAIHAVFNDCNASHEQTLLSLELLRDEIDILIDETKEGIERLRGKPEP